MSAAVDLHGVVANRRPWTPAEDALIRARYAREGIGALRSLLQGRSDAAIFHRASRLRVSTETHRRWTRGDDARLRNLWDSATPLRAIAAALERTQAACYVRAQALGLQLGVPQGFEPLTHAAKRAGYSVDTLRRILRRRGGAIHERLARPTKASPRHRMAFVDPAEVDRAVAKHLARECVNTAARIRDVSPSVLRRLLRAEGLEPPPGKRRWMVATATIDRVLADSAQRETVRRAALRVGVTPYSLGEWLRDAGVIVGKQPAHRRWVRRGDVERVVAERRARPTCRARRTP